MSLLETWVATPVAGALGWTLLHSLWQGTIVSAALAAALLATRSSRARYAVACVALGMMLAGFGFTLLRMAPGRAHNLQNARAPAFPAWNVRTEIDAPAPSSPGLAAVAPWLAPFWLVGVCVVYLGHLAAWISVCRLRRRGVCCVPDIWQNELVRLSARLRVSRPIALLESCLADTPMVLGHFRPVILLPIGLLAGLPAGQIEAILLHELAHIRRHDYLLNALQRLVEGLLFYHPATWWISRVIRTERENCCDDVVVETTGNAHEYAVALAALEQNRRSDLEPAVAATGGSLMKRIRRLLYPRRPNGAWSPLLAAIILMTTAAVVLTAWQSPPQPKSAPAGRKAGRGETSPKAALPSPYTAWVNEDVVYIINDEERAMFRRLVTDDEMQQFIVQFWLRRDPTPGTVENEFKEEHYRRIAYANERFRTASGTSGWQTDRGHMYIVYGPPDEIESHPQGDALTYPFETWRYWHVEGIGDKVYFRFVDRAATGDYRLAPGKLP